MKAHTCTLLLLHALACFASERVLYVSPSPAESPCPAEPCHTLSEYAHNIDKYVSDNTKFVFLPGTHYLDTDFRVSNISSLVLLGDNSSLPELSSSVLCSNTAAMVAITGVSQLLMSNLEVAYCRSVLSISMEMVDSATLSSFHLLNSKTLNIYKSTALLEDTNFTNNTGTGCGGSVRIEYSNVTLNGTSSFTHSNTSESGGGMCVIESSLIAHGNVTFYGNSVIQDGGGLFVNSSFILKFTGTITFSGNYANGSGGGIAAYSNVTFSGAAIFSYNRCNSIGSAFYSDASIDFTGDTVFAENEALANVSCGMNCYFSKPVYVLSVRESIVSKNSLLIRRNGLGYFRCSCIIESFGYTHLSGFVNVSDNCGGICLGGVGKLQGNFTFSRNHATALDIDSINITIEGSFLFLDNSNEGSFSAIQSNITVLSNTSLQFIGNRDKYEDGGALDLLESVLILLSSSSIVFIRNHASKSGGAVYFYDSYIELSTNTTLDFTDNTVEDKGGAIYMRDTIPSLYCLSDDFITRNTYNCFFQVPQDYKYSDIMLTFHNNSATSSSDIYGGMLNWCNLKFHNTTSFSDVLNHTVPHYDALDVSSPPFQLCYCAEDTMDCMDNLLEKTVYPGEIINISVVAKGQNEGISPATVVIHPIEPFSGTTLLPVYGPYTSVNCSTIEYKVVSVTLDDAFYGLAVDNCGSDVQSKNAIYIRIHMKMCLSFFELDSGFCQCNKLKKYAKVDCDITDQSIAREGSTWIGYDNASESYIIHQYCPLDYCTTKRVCFNYTQVDRQCKSNRKGQLCGECIERYSLLMGTSQCGKCTNKSILWFIFFAFAGVALVVLLLVLRLTVVDGTINGLIFYINIFQSNKYEFIGSKNKSVVLELFLAWLNLDLGIKSCLYDGMDTYQNTWLQFLFPLYIWVLIGIVILSSRWSSWVTRKLGTNPVAVLATLVFLSYNKILHTVVTIVSATNLLYVNTNSSENKSLVWLYDANISYLGSKHAPLFGVALLFICLFLLPYTLLLVFGPCIQAKSNLKIFCWVNKPMFKYFLDNYHAPYQNRHRYWTGLMLLVRIAILIVFVSDVSNDPLQYLLAIITVVIFVGSRGWTLGTLGIYKNHWIDLLNVSFMFNLVILSTVILFCESEQVRKENQIIIGYVSLGVAFVTFLGIIIYHVYLQLQNTKIVKKLKYTFRNKSEEENDSLIDILATRSRHDIS